MRAAPEEAWDLAALVLQEFQPPSSRVFLEPSLAKVVEEAWASPCSPGARELLKEGQSSLMACAHWVPLQLKILQEALALWAACEEGWSRELLFWQLGEGYHLDLIPEYWPEVVEAVTLLSGFTETFWAWAAEHPQELARLEEWRALVAEEPPLLR